ncbi:hypothetical protein Ancab_039805 [Ancistrocladus abbreviatus]
MLPLFRQSRCSSSQLERFLPQPFLKFSFSIGPTNSTANNEEQCRPGPPPIRVALTESAGRGVFATRRIGPGELIHTARPLVSHPTITKIDSVCYLCLRKLKPRDDLQAQYAPFCSEECWKQSKIALQTHI